jgi:hypothetical protein
VQVIARFDALVERRAGLPSILTAAAAITRCPARLVDAQHGIDMLTAIRDALLGRRWTPSATPTTWLFQDSGGDG